MKSGWGQKRNCTFSKVLRNLHWKPFRQIFEAVIFINCPFNHPHFASFLLLLINMVGTQQVPR